MSSQAFALLAGVKWRQSNPSHIDPATAGSGEDIRMMKTVLEAKGFTSANIALLDTEAATATAILSGLSEMASQANPGDLVVFFNSSHGGQVTDILPDKDEEDGLDETICAYDRDVVDDEIFLRLREFRRGVRLVFVNDACNSGTTLRVMEPVAAMRAPDGAELFRLKMLAMPRPFFEREVRSWDLPAELIYFGGASDGTTSAGFPQGGAFTLALHALLYNGAYGSGYEQFYQDMRASLQYQVPTIRIAPNVSAAFRDQSPFTI